MDTFWLVLESLLKIVFVLTVLLTYAPVLVFAERRQSAMIQDRVGPYKAGFPMPKALLEALPLLQLGAYLVALTTLFVFITSVIYVAIGRGDEVLFTEPFFGIDHTWGGLMVAMPFIGLPHFLIGKILPTLFDNGHLTVYGLLHPLADAVKMIWKEDFVPPRGDKLLHALAPIIATIPVFATFAVIPFGPTLYLDQLFTQLPAVGTPEGTAVMLQVANLNVGILYVFAIAGTGIVGAAIAGYASDNKFSLLGGLRAASQMVSYEVVLGLSLVGCFMLYDSLLLSDAVAWQHENVWGIFVQPLAFVLFMTATIAEYKRIPFDAPEGESEIVAGYFLEYSGMKFGMFMMGEFIEVVTSSALITTLFLGGYHVPFLTDGGWEAFGYRFDLMAPGWHAISDLANSHLFVSLVRVGAFLLKVAALCFLSIQIRWTLPRFRYDQTMQLCWKLILPLSLANVLVTGLFILLWS